ncbi:CDP-alcohol phosphatidyltransferase family protein [Dongia sp.]|uniref:CDP-alcohol phosphatidyltransferase family protein n=1 Tax=Dongia sp. TaxID=1977262 RepID=UPI0035AF1DCB
MTFQTDRRSGPIFIHESDETIWGLTPRQRIERMLARADRAGGIADLVPNLVFRADVIFDEALIRALLQHPGKALLDDRNRPVAAHCANADDLAPTCAAIAGGDRASLPGSTAPVDAAGLASNYNKALRRKGAPYLFVLGDLPVAEIERRMYLESYKGVTDVVTKHVWPVPALHVTRFCAKAGISPNMVTLVSFICVLLATWAFAVGAFGPGLVAAWAMCFLDTVDGKLARVTLTSSKWGNVFDHGTDLVHPPFWYWAWYEGLGGAAVVAPWTFWVIIAGYILGRGQEGLFIWQFGIEMHIWRPLDSAFRQITARRNPNLIILSIATLCDAPALGFEIVAWWTIISFAFHCLRIAQAYFARARGVRLQSWLTEAA